jgi:hypothetical protein
VGSLTSHNPIDLHGPLLCTSHILDTGRFAKYDAIAPKLNKVVLTPCVCLQIEREKADLSVQVIQFAERLEEAEGGAESQVSLTTTHQSSVKTREVGMWACGHVEQ